jgi:hypothetical protein
MQFERRKIVRRPVNYPARIDVGDGSDLVSCTLVDASDEGVQIVTIKPVEWPKMVELVLGYNGRRRCRVAWVNGRRAGLEFLKDGQSVPLELPAEAPPEHAPPPSTPSHQPERALAPAAADAFDIDTLPPAR